MMNLLRRLFQRNLEKDAINDKPDDRDWDYTEVIGSEPEIKEKKFLMGNDVDRQDQSKPNTPTTRMACGSYGMAHSKNVAEKTTLLGKNLRADFVKAYDQLYRIRYNMDPLKDGSYLQHQVNFAMKQKHIAGYAKVPKTPERFKEALKNNNPIYTGTNNINWSGTRKDNKAHIGRGSGHAFMIDGWDGEWFRCRNSYGPNYMDNGWFWLHEDDIDVLFTCYAIFPLEQQEVVDSFRETIEKAKEKILNKKQKPKTVIEKIIYNNRERF